MARKKLSQKESDGRKVATYCARKPRTMAEIQRKLGDAPRSRARRAIEWVTDQREMTRNPFLCVCESRRYLYGFRSDFYDEVAVWLLREFGYNATRMATAVTAMHHSLVTTDTLSGSLGKAERTVLNRWRRIMEGQVAAAEQVVNELEEMLAG